MVRPTWTLKTFLWVVTLAGIALAGMIKGEVLLTVSTIYTMVVFYRVAYLKREPCAAVAVLFGLYFLLVLLAVKNFGL